MSRDAIRVFARVRPLINEIDVRRDGKLAPESTWDVRSTQVARELSEGKTFVFDRVFAPSTRTRELYDDVAGPIVDDVMQGVNGTVFVYGQTSSGKTHTMTGNAQEAGLTPLVVDHIFSHIEASQTQKFLLRVSYLEIYNEEVRDLLSPGSGNLAIRQNRDKSFYAEGLAEEIVRSATDVHALLKKGTSNRQGTFRAAKSPPARTRKPAQQIANVPL